MNTIEIINYALKSGKEPFAEWVKGLDRNERAIIRARINRVRMGNFGDCYPVKAGVSELRIHQGPGYRVYFGEKGSRVILLFGGIKRTQERDIEKAQRYWKNYKV